MDLVVVLTSPRPNASYLAETLAGFERIGMSTWTRLLVSDGPLTECPAGWELVQHPQPLGNRVGMWRAFERATARGADRLLFLEDDITVCRNFFEYAAQLVVPLAATFISFFDAFKKPCMKCRKKFQYLPMNQFLFNQAVLFPRRTFTQLAAIDPNAIVLPHKRTSRHGADEVIARVLPGNYALHIPHLVQHNGVVSAVRWRAIQSRVSKFYVGDDFNAMTLAGPEEVNIGSASSGPPSGIPRS